MLIEPRDPLIPRDGRPFTNSPGARARSLAFPLPQTLAGAYRTRRGLAEGLSFPQDAPKTLSWGIRGPLLAEADGEGWRLLLPRPLDAVRLGETVYPLVPLRLPEGAGTNLPKDLLPVGLGDPSLKEKPSPLPAWWYWDSFQKWLVSPQTGFQPRGHQGPTLEVRTHVSLDPSTGTGREGALFQTQGLEFSRQEGQEGKRDARSLAQVRRLALVVWPEDGRELRGVHPLGGERRLAYWEEGGPQIPTPPVEVVDQVLRHRAARVVLLTPSFFHEDFLPQGRSLMGAPVVAALVGRAVVVSGWDLKEGRPKPTRRAVPAGSVYFVRLPQEWNEARVRAWLDAAWFQNIADGEQDRKDGFGLAAVGAWDGKPLEWR